MAKLESGRAEWTNGAVDIVAVVRESMDSERTSSSAKRASNRHLPAGKRPGIVPPTGTAWDPGDD